MKILYWNVALNTVYESRKLDNHFVDAKKSRKELIAERILDESPDVVVLSEMQRYEYDRDNDKNRIEGTKQARAEVVANKLQSAGYICEYSTAKYSNEPDDAQDHPEWSLQFTAIKGNAESIINVDKKPHDRECIAFCGRNWLGVTIKNEHTKILENGAINVLGLHMPNSSDKRRKPFWEAVYNETKKDGDTIIVGDFNAFLPKDIAETVDPQTNSQLQPILDKGWIDAWEKVNNHIAPQDVDRYTYYYNVIGRRLDYAFISPGLNDKLIYAKHLHDVREQKLSDHSALLIKLKDLF